jgi:hypothetical protein
LLVVVVVAEPQILAHVRSGDFGGRFRWQISVQISISVSISVTNFANFGDANFGAISVVISVTVY